MIPLRFISQCIKVGFSEFDKGRLVSDLDIHTCRAGWAQTGEFFGLRDSPGASLAAKGFEDARRLLGCQPAEGPLANRTVEQQYPRRMHRPYGWKQLRTVSILKTLQVDIRRIVRHGCRPHRSSARRLPCRTDLSAIAPAGRAPLLTAGRVSRPCSSPRTGD